MASYDPAIVVVAEPTMLATTLSAVFDTSMVPLFATTPCGLSSEAPVGAVNVTAEMVSGVAAEAVTTLLAAVDTTVPHTAHAMMASRVRLLDMGGHLSVVVGFPNATTRRYPGRVTPCRTTGEGAMK